MKLKCVRKIKFDAGHRLVNHESKCSNLHGHQYLAFITAVAPSLDGIGRIIDFSVIKDKVGGWIDKHWDHTTILFEEDTQTIEALSTLTWNKPLFIFPYNPTAENMAKYLLEVVCPKVLEGTGVTVSKVQLWETENCYAEAEISECSCKKGK